MGGGLPNSYSLTLGVNLLRHKSLVIKFSFRHRFRQCRIRQSGQRRHPAAHRFRHLVPILRRQRRLRRAQSVHLLRGAAQAHLQGTVEIRLKNSKKISKNFQKHSTTNGSSLSLYGGGGGGGGSVGSGSGGGGGASSAANGFVVGGGGLVARSESIGSGTQRHQHQYAHFSGDGVTPTTQ